MRCRTGSTGLCGSAGGGATRTRSTNWPPKFRPTAVQLDVTDLEGARHCYAKVESELGTIDVLVNNAGVIGPISELADAKFNEWEHCIRTNLIGAANMVATVLPGMLAAGTGTIVNLSTSAVDRPITGLSAYCASKIGLAMLTRSINHEYGDQGIMAFGFRPGVVATPMQETIHSSEINPLAHISISDMLAAEKPAEAIAWLIENRPAQWCGAIEPDIRDAEFKKQVWQDVADTLS